MRKCSEVHGAGDYHKRMVGECSSSATDSSPKKLRDTAYMSLIRPASEYSCSVWHPHIKSNRTKLKKFSTEQLDLFRTILGVKQVSQKCYTI